MDLRAYAAVDEAYDLRRSRTEAVLVVAARKDTTAEGSGCAISCPFRLRNADRTAPLPTAARIRSIGLGADSYHSVLSLKLVLQRVGIGMS